MAVISELIDVGLRLKEQGNQKSAIEHFRQLHSTYPGNARIMFELAASWGEFGVPEQALPLYRELKALPKAQGLPPKDMPRLYLRLGSTLFDLHEYGEALTVIEEGLRLHPTYRPLRAFRIFTLSASGSPDHALLDALDLMLESLAPSRWDIFENEIKQIVSNMRGSLAAIDDLPIRDRQASDNAEMVELRTEDHSEKPDETRDNSDEMENEAEVVVGHVGRRKIDIVETADTAEVVELEVKVVQPATKTSPRREKDGQFGKRAVRIDIGETSNDDDQSSDNDAPAGKVTIPIDVD